MTFKNWHWKSHWCSNIQQTTCLEIPKITQEVSIITLKDNYIINLSYFLILKLAVQVAWFLYIMSGITLERHHRWMKTQHIPELKIIMLFMFKQILKVSKSKQWNNLIVNLKLLQHFPTCTWHVFNKNFYPHLNSS